MKTLLSYIQFHNKYEFISFLTSLLPFIIGNVDKVLGVILMLYGLYNTHLSIKLKRKELNDDPTA